MCAYGGVRVCCTRTVPTSTAASAKFSYHFHRFLERLAWLTLFFFFHFCSQALFLRHKEEHENFTAVGVLYRHCRRVSFF